VIPGYLSLDQYVSVALTSYIYKLTIALLLTPFIYGSHSLIDRFLGKEMIHENVKHRRAGIPIKTGVPPC
jgi:uncharacterized PurR-regulated membrane protein YhhQ (DUF165 family)